jgi:hypothetical protein
MTVSERRPLSLITGIDTHRDLAVETFLLGPALESY